MALHVVYQALDFDLARTRAFVDHLAATRPDLRPTLREVVVGDASCTFRNQHTVAARWDEPDFVAFRAWCRDEGLALRWQLPLVVKEHELKTVLEVAERVWDGVDGFGSGDVGLLLELADRMASLGERRLVLTGNVHNPTAASLIAERLPPIVLRPLFPKVSLLERGVGLPREIVAFGNMLINCSIYCFHCGDLPTRCDYSCVAPKHLVMEGERVAMVGRSLTTTDNRLDLIDVLPRLPDVQAAVITDLDLLPAEAVDAVARIAAVSGRPAA